MFPSSLARGRLWQAKRGDKSSKRRGNSNWRHLANATCFRSAKNMHRKENNNQVRVIMIISDIPERGRNSCIDQKCG